MNSDRRFLKGSTDALTRPIQGLETEEEVAAFWFWFECFGAKPSADVRKLFDELHDGAA